MNRAVEEALARAYGRPAVDTETAATLLGVSPDALWRAGRAGKAPVRFYRVGRRVVWPTAPILQLLGLDDYAPPSPGQSESQAATPGSRHTTLTATNPAPPNGDGNCETT